MPSNRYYVIHYQQVCISALVALRVGSNTLRPTIQYVLADHREDDLLQILRATAHTGLSRMRRCIEMFGSQVESCRF
jgi:hypothetical protein